MVKAIDNEVIKLTDDDFYEKDQDALPFFNDKEQILCNVIVRAVHDVYSKQGKMAEEILAYLDTDCEHLEDEETLGKVSECFSLASRGHHEIRPSSSVTRYWQDMGARSTNT